MSAKEENEFLKMVVETQASCISFCCRICHVQQVLYGTSLLQAGIGIWSAWSQDPKGDPCKLVHYFSKEIPPADLCAAS